MTGPLNPKPRGRSLKQRDIALTPIGGRNEELTPVSGSSEQI